MWRFLCAFLLLTVGSQASPKVQETPESIAIQLDEGLNFGFMRKGPLLVGLNRVQVDGRELTSPDTFRFPLLAQAPLC